MGKKWKIYQRKINTHGTPLLNLCESKQDRKEREDNIGKWSKWSIYAESSYKKVRDRWFKDLNLTSPIEEITKDLSPLTYWNKFNFSGKTEYQLGELINEEDIKIEIEKESNSSIIINEDGFFTFILPYQLETPVLGIDFNK